MGADLYLNSVFGPHFEHYEVLFDEWVQRRDELQKAGHLAEAKAAQVKVDESYEKMYERGYFRDSYNASNLLWLFHLDWWGHVMDMLDDEGMMSPAHAQTLLGMLSDREATFETNLQRQEPSEGEIKTEVEHYFREKYKRFRRFLEEAVQLNEAIDCSI